MFCDILYRPFCYLLTKINHACYFLQESGNAELRPLAYQRLLRLVQRDPLNERIYFNLGMIAMDDRDYRNAEKWFRKVRDILFTAL